MYSNEHWHGVIPTLYNLQTTCLIGHREHDSYISVTGRTWYLCDWEKSYLSWLVDSSNFYEKGNSAAKVKLIEGYKTTQDICYLKLIERCSVLCIMLRPIILSTFDNKDYTSLALNYFPNQQKPWFKQRFMHDL